MKIVVSSEELESNKTSIQEKLNQTIKSEMSTWKISFHKLFDEEKFAKLLHTNLSCGLSKNLVDNEEMQETENETLLTSSLFQCTDMAQNITGSKEQKNLKFLPTMCN